MVSKIYYPVTSWIAVWIRIAICGINKSHCMFVFSNIRPCSLAVFVTRLTRSEKIVCGQYYTIYFWHCNTFLNSLGTNREPWSHTTVHWNSKMQNKVIFYKRAYFFGRNLHFMKESIFYEPVYNNKCQLFNFDFEKGPMIINTNTNLTLPNSFLATHQTNST